MARFASKSVRYHICAHCRSWSYVSHLDWYYLAFPKDRWQVKLLVYGVAMLDTAQTILVTSDIFDAYARHFGDQVVLNTSGLEWFAVPVLNGIRTSTMFV